MKILRESGCNTNCENEIGDTAFYAACNENYEVVKYLIECEEIDKNKPSKFGRTPFCVACEKGHLNIAIVLLENGANIDTPDYYNWTPFEISVYEGNLATVSFLLSIGVEITEKCVENAAHDEIILKLNEEMSKRSLILS